MESELVKKFNDIKSNFTNIGGKISDAKSRISNMINKYDYLNTNNANPKALTQLKGMIDDIKSKTDRADQTYSNMRDLMPQAAAIVPRLKNNSLGLGLNMAPVIGITAAAAGVIAAVYGLGKLLDPVEQALNKQAALLDDFAAGHLSEDEYNRQADEITAELNNQGYDIQKQTGVNIPVVISGAAVIYIGYKLLSKAGVI